MLLLGTFQHAVGQISSEVHYVSKLAFCLDLLYTFVLLVVEGIIVTLYVPCNE